MLKDYCFFATVKTLFCVLKIPKDEMYGQKYQCNHFKNPQHVFIFLIQCVYAIDMHPVKSLG